MLSLGATFIWSNVHAPCTSVLLVYTDTKWYDFKCLHVQAIWALCKWKAQKCNKTSPLLLSCKRAPKQKLQLHCGTEVRVHTPSINASHIHFLTCQGYQAHLWGPAAGKVKTASCLIARNVQIDYIGYNSGTSHTWMWATSQPLSIGLVALHKVFHNVYQCLWWFLTNLPEARMRGQVLMLDEKAWLTVSAAIHSKGLPLGRDQDSMQASWVLFHHPHPGLALCTGAVILELERAIPKVFPQSWEHETVQIASEFYSMKSFFHWS